MFSLQASWHAGPGRIVASSITPTFPLPIRTASCRSAATAAASSISLRCAPTATELAAFHHAACMHALPSPKSRTSVRTHSSSAATPVAAEKPKKSGLDLYLVGSILAVVAFGTLNRVFNKMAVVPLGNYVFFLAQAQTFGYCLVYFTVLWFRRKQRLVTPEMLAAPKRRNFLIIGGLEASAQVVSLIGVSRIPGVVLPLLQQSLLLWQVLVGYVLLGKRYAAIQIAGVLLVVSGVAKAAWPSGTGASVFSQVDPLYAGLFSGSFLLLAIGAVVKDTIFQDAKAKLGGKDLDIFVVNSFSSAAQAVFVFLLLPLLSHLKGISLRQLPSYLSQGLTCLRGLTPSCGSDCSGAPALAAMYIVFNLLFNISFLNLLRYAGPVVATLTLSAIIPITIYAFTFPWPYLGTAPQLGANFLLGTAIMLMGLVVYNWPTLTSGKNKTA